MSSHEIELYGKSIVAEVIASAEAENALAPDIFTRQVLDDLELAGEVENTFVAYYRSHGTEISAYGENESLGTLDLFLSFFTHQPSAERLTRARVEALIKRLYTFLQKCDHGFKKSVDRDSDVHDMCIAIEQKLLTAQRIRLFLLTNATAVEGPYSVPPFQDLPVTIELWDLARLHRMATSGTLSEPISVDFDPPLPCLSTQDNGDDYSVILAIIPGTTLSDLYGRYGTRLLELNVRSFLQTKGAINRGIRDTLLNSPRRFLAYNNGVTATASEVELTQLDGGQQAISRLHDLQIVNGGQTTASIHYAKTKDKADVSVVHVQMKLTIVAPEHLPEIVPEISKYSNTQNKVTAVDFSSNHPFHIAIEQTTRSLWAPAATGTARETKWFYERARGQYADALARERTPASQRKFRETFPVPQRFSKADVAKYLHAWTGLPHLVSRGAEKNFREFMLKMGDAPPEVDLAYAQQLLAKAILFKSIDRIVAAQDFGGYKINITAYTMARLAQATERRIPLGGVWRDQAITEATTAAAADLCHFVRDIIFAPRKGNHIGEWTKKIECWTAVLELDWEVPSALQLELSQSSTTAEPQSRSDGESAGDQKWVMSIPSEDWFAVSKWAKETGNLQPWQRQLAYGLGRLIAQATPPSERQAVQGRILMEKAISHGFRGSSEVQSF